MKLFLTVMVLALIGAMAIYARKKFLHIWIVDYLLGCWRCWMRAADAQQVIDLMVLCVDHFEWNNQTVRIDAWQQQFPNLMHKHCDADGCMPKHTFFYALDLLHETELAVLKTWVQADYGEVELHWHHQHDTEATFLEKLDAALPIFHAHGHLLPYKSDQSACFAFIHGNWSLANARGSEFCGVDNEIALLKQRGCYADFTFPALFNAAQPHWVNAIGYCQQQRQPRGYEQVREAAIGTQESESEFMIFQGPLSINWRDWRHVWHPTFEDGDLKAAATHGDPKRIDEWIRQGIHVQGRPNWLFVKLFCHGAQDHQAVLGAASDQMYSYLEQNYNDGLRYRLHYVTAREAYNIVKAAEDLQQGNPHQFRNYRIPPPQQRAGFNA